MSQYPLVHESKPLEMAGRAGGTESSGARKEKKFVNLHARKKVRHSEVPKCSQGESDGGAWLWSRFTDGWEQVDERNNERTRSRQLAVVMRTCREITKHSEFKV